MLLLEVVGGVGDGETSGSSSTVAAGVYIAQNEQNVQENQSRRV